MNRLEFEGAYHWDNNKSNSFKYIWRGLLSGERGEGGLLEPQCNN